jgi:NAD+ kinase
MTRVTLIVNNRKPSAVRLADGIVDKLGKIGIDASVISFNSDEDITIAEAPDIALSVGGDGTVLFTARTMAPLGVPILPIHMGTLGFITAVSGDGWEPVFQGWLAGKAGVSERIMLEITVERAGKSIFTHCGLNDAVISSDGIAKVINLDVGLSNEQSTIHMGRFRSDGLIAATATGSTAYSSAAGGPILDPEMDALIINPICPTTLANRPIVIPAAVTAIVNVLSEQRSGVILTVDGQVTFPLLPCDRVVVSRTAFKAKLVGAGRNSFFDALRGKLAWSGGDADAA